MPFDATDFVDQQTLNDLHLIQKARHRIRVPQLWCRDHLVSGNRLCMLGAIAYASGASLEEIRRVNDGAVMSKQVEDHYDHIISIIERYIPGYVLPDYNDDCLVAHTDILALFDRVIADYRHRVGLEV